MSCVSFLKLLEKIQNNTIISIHMKGESFFKLGSNFSNQLPFVDRVPKTFENCANVFLITTFANQKF